MARPVSAKVSVGALGGSAVSAITWILTTYIPAFHSGIPPTLQPVIPAILGVIGYFTTGYSAKHQATVEEIETAFQDAEKVISLFQGPLPLGTHNTGVTTHNVSVVPTITDGPPPPPSVVP